MNLCGCDARNKSCRPTPGEGRCQSGKHRRPPSRSSLSRLLAAPLTNLPGRTWTDSRQAEVNFGWRQTAAVLNRSVSRPDFCTVVANSTRTWSTNRRRRTGSENRINNGTGAGLHPAIQGRHLNRHRRCTIFDSVPCAVIWPHQWLADEGQKFSVYDRSWWPFISAYMDSKPPPTNTGSSCSTTYWKLYSR